MMGTDCEARLSGEQLPVFGTAAILAGGKSSRMGFDKQLLMEDERRVLERVIELLKEEFTDILIVTARPELYEGMDVRLCSDLYRDRGPLAGVHAAMLNARSRYVYLLACDMPVVNLPFIRHMKQRLLDTGKAICACECGGRTETFNTFYSRDLLADVVCRLETGNASLFRFITGNDACVIPSEEAARFDGQLRMFLNINTPGEYAWYLRTVPEEPEDSPLADRMDILRYTGGQYMPLRDLMVHEHTLQILVQGVPLRTLYCSPDQLRELAAGHLLTEGHIRCAGDLLSLELDETGGRASAVLAPGAPDRCPPRVQEGPVFDPRIILENQQRFFDRSTLQKATAGTHCCALCDDSGTYFSCIDISRHNCMDKLAGKALLEGIPLGDKYILTSGRVPLDMIRKVQALGVPMIVSRSTPTIAAVEAAREAGITLLGFSRESRFNIYSAPGRLLGCPGFPEP